MCQLDEGPEVGEESLRREGLHGYAVREQDIRDAACADLGGELGEPRAVILVGVVLGVIAHLDAELGVLAVEVEDGAADIVVEVVAGEAERGLGRHLSLYV